MQNIVKIGIAGLGNVGKSVYQIASKINKVQIVAVSAKTPKDFIADNIKFYQNPLDLACDPEIDIVIELIGSYETAKQLIITALQQQKKVITANKALLATCGYELANIAHQHNSVIAYEAAVAGSIPIIKNFQQGFVANQISEIYAILNGTCNFILTKMSSEKQDFLPALALAQQLGFAESDPTFDIEGIDTAHKICLLSALAQKCRPDFNNMYIEGITKISANDINLADQLGYKIKLLAIYKQQQSGIQQYVYPALVKKDSKIGQVDSSYNCILTKGNYFDYNFIVGRGAGGDPTASAVIADLFDLINGTYSSNLFSCKPADLQNANILPIKSRVGNYFIRLDIDRANGLYDLSTIFEGKIECKQASFIDLGNNKIACGIITDTATEQAIINILELLDKTFVIAAKFIRIEDIDF